MDSFFTVLSLGYYQLKQNLTKEKIHVAAAFAMPIKRNGEIDILQNTSNDDTINLNTLLFNSYNDSSSKNNNENNK